MSEGIHLVETSSPSLPLIIESIVDIHASCILRDYTMATFIPPLSRKEMIENWQSLVFQTINGSRFILIYISKVSDRSPKNGIPPPFEEHDWQVLQPPPGKDSESQAHLEVSGVVSLSMPTSQTGPFRGLVQKLFVSPFHRRKGIATQLLADLERRALELDKWSLMLDTTVGTPAEHMYPKLGYETLGTVREYGYSPKDKSLVDEVFYWKDLRPSRR